MRRATTATSIMTDLQIIFHRIFTFWRKLHCWRTSSVSGQLKAAIGCATVARGPRTPRPRRVVASPGPATLRFRAAAAGQLHLGAAPMVPPFDEGIVPVITFPAASVSVTV